MRKCLWTIFWIVVLIFVAYPIAFFFAEFYVLLCPLQGCCDGCTGLVEFLLKLTQLPLACARNAASGKSLCS
uniref:Venom toxin-like peptide-6 n=1 Tax=Mesobuthus eupeus TaxID=34648 RepID=E4VP29_MESEU|nr:venom toxin-like peptide-6 [Mesobuthus eupeus]